MLVVSVNVLRDKEYEEIGIAKGSVVRSKHVGKDILAGLRSIVGGEIDEYTQMLNEARQIAHDRMVKEATALGATGIIAVRYENAAVMANAAEILAYGTAIRFK